MQWNFCIMKCVCSNEGYHYILMAIHQSACSFGQKVALTQGVEVSRTDRSD